VRDIAKLSDDERHRVSAADEARAKVGATS
jgi:hypothetical protein